MPRSVERKKTVVNNSVKTGTPVSIRTCVKLYLRL